MENNHKHNFNISNKEMLFVSIMHISMFVTALKPYVQCELSRFLKNVNTFFLLIEPIK
jgi:hypothetical protein